jgi:hypothetical protein
VRANGFMMLRALFLACTCGVLVCAKTPLTQLPASPAEFAWACTGPLARFPSLDGITPGDLVSFPTYQCFPRGITPPTEWDSNAWPLPVVNVLYDASFLDGAVRCMRTPPSTKFKNRNITFLMRFHGMVSLLRPPVHLFDDMRAFPLVFLCPVRSHGRSRGH